MNSTMSLLSFAYELDLFSVLLTLAFLLIVLYVCTRPQAGLPPFPATPIPVLGNLLSLEKDPRALFRGWKKNHGDIFSVYFGPRLAVVLNGIDVMKEAMVKNGDVFSDRPKLPLFSLLLHDKGILASSGESWKSQRKFTLSSLREFGFGRKSMETGVLEEVRHVLEFFAKRKGEKHEFSDIYNISTSNVICVTLFGHRFSYDDANFLACCKALNTVVANVSNVSLFNFFPFLKYIPGALKSCNVAMENVAYFGRHLIDVEINQHLEEFDGTTPDFVSAYIKEIKERESAGLDVAELKDNFSQIITELFMAGTETTATTLKWMILFLIRNPGVQEKCFREIKDNIGFKRFPTLKDKSLLPYLESMIAETQRRSNIVPFSIMHATAKETTFRGFTIPKETMVMMNMESVLMDPKEWPEPEEFRPERFLDQSGAFIKRESLIPFSLGRRVCLGEALAKMELFLFSAALIQSFKFESPDDEPSPSLEPVVSVTSAPRSYKIKALRRNDTFPENDVE